MPEEKKRVRQVVEEVGSPASEVMASRGPEKEENKVELQKKVEEVVETKRGISSSCCFFDYFDSFDSWICFWWDLCLLV
jgi:hypothetical protein